MVLKMLKQKDQELSNINLLNQKLDRLNEELCSLRILIDNPESIINCITNAFVQFNILYREIKKDIEMSKTNLILIQQDIQDIFALLKNKEQQYLD